MHLRDTTLRLERDALRPALAPGSRVHELDLACLTASGSQQVQFPRKGQLIAGLIVQLEILHFVNERDLRSVRGGCLLLLMCTNRLLLLS